MSDGETFLNRWARRKAETRRHEEDGQTPEAEPRPAAPGKPQAEAGLDPSEAGDVPPDEETRQRWIAELETVDIETLTYEDDFAIYMKGWVPAALRQRALRKLWTAHPALACLDGLNDYEDDYTDAATVVANLKTDWLPGRGYKWLDSLGEDEVTAAAEPADVTEPAEEAAELGEAHAADEDQPEESESAPPDDRTA